MSLLIIESATYMLQNWDETLINGKFNPQAFYQIVQLAATGLTKKIQNKKYKNALYTQMNKYLEEEDITRAKKIINLLKKEIDDDRAIINKYIEEQQELEEEGTNQQITQYTKHAIGYLSYGDS